MKTCPNCQNTEKDDAKFCTKCGVNLPDYQQKGENTNIFSGQQTNVPNPNQQPPPPMNPYFQQPPPPMNPYYQQPPPPMNPYYQQPPPGAYGYPVYSGPVSRPMGITLIAIYEIIFGALIALLGLYFFVFSTSFNVQLADALYGTNYFVILFIFGIIGILWGAIGILGGYYFLKWKQSGLVLTYIFLISTGLLLYSFFLIPSLIAITAIIYFNFSNSFKQIFEFMKYNGYRH